MRNKAAANKRRGSLLAATLLVFLPTHSSAQSALEKAIRARQSGYFLMGQHMSRIGATVKGELPFDKSNMAISAELIDLVSRVVIDNFPEGSDKGTTRAKPEIWKEAPRFRQLAQASQVEVTKLKTAVQTGDIQAVKVAFGTASKSCKACHEAFRDD